MLERTFYLEVCGEPGIIIIEAGIDKKRVYPVDQIDLYLRELSAVDCERVYSVTPQCDGV